MREKRGLLVVLLVLVLALSAVQVVAEEGCYLYLDGAEDLYCNSVAREVATADCELYGDCDIGTIFIPGECDLEAFPQCEDVTCSVDCSPHKLGICEELGRTVDESLVGVAVTAENNAFWCEDRCASAGPYCSNGPVKRWEALEGAFNRGLPEGSIDESFDHLSVSACIDWCGTDIGTGSLTGLVLADGEGVENALITLDNGDMYTSLPTGSYEFNDLTSRNYIVRVTHEDYSPQQMTLFIPSDEVVEQNFNLVVTDDYVISGVVTDSVTGDGLSATITWEGPTTRRIIAGVDGIYTTDALPPGTYELTAGKARYASETRTVTIVDSPKVEDFALVAAEKQGISGTVTYVGGIVARATILVDGRARGFSNADGDFFIDLPQGSYQVSAAWSDYETDISVPATVVVGEVETVELRLVRAVSDCPEGELPSVSEIMATPVPGEPKVTVSWTKPCSAVQQYKINVYSCTESGTCSEVPDHDFTASAVEAAKVDSDVEWEKYYRYEISVQYPGVDSLWSESVFGDLVYVGDRACANRFNPATGWDSFCQVGEDTNQIVFECANNKLIEKADCSERDEYCAPINQHVANCESQNMCTAGPQGAGPFGLFFDRTSCYGTSTPQEGSAQACYYDSTETVPNACFQCSGVTHCADYQSEDACGINNCLTEVCTWYDVGDESIVDYNLIFPDLDLPEYVTAETGKGFCGQAVYNDDDQCYRCGGEGDIFENNFCTAEICSGLGQCFADQDLTTCSECGEEPTDVANCYTYETEYECTEDEPFAIVSGRSVLSNDQCGWGRCVWEGNSDGTGNCIKDGDGNSLSDCESFSPDERNICERDNQPPVTNVEEVGVVSTVDPLLLFSATDNEALGKLHYCLLDASSGATAYCDDDVFEKNSYSFDRVFSDDVDVDILAGLDRLVDGQTYRLQYYSVDHYRNQEDLRETFIFLDNKVPEFTLDTQIITIGDTTELTVEVLGYLEPVSCTFLLDQRFPIGTLRSEEKTLEEEKTAAFNDLKGIHYNLTVNCKDQAGNVGTEEEWLVFDLAPNIDVVYPEIDGGVSTTRIEFEVHTDTASLCELRTVREDVKIADFLPEDDLKVHVTDSITGFFENTYYDTHKVVCTEALSGEEQTDYFSFAVDFTPPETKIVLKEGTRTERPLGLSWEASFVEQATMTFECDGGAVDCDKTFYCLGDSCATTRKEAFTEFVAQVFVNETTDVCYYSVDEGGNDAFPQCGTITIDGFGITLEQPEGYNYQNELWGVSNTSFFDVQFYTRVPSTECRYDFISGFTYESLSPHKILSPVEGHYLLPNFPNSTFSTYPSSGGVKTLYMVCEDSTGVKAPEQAINLEYDPSAPKITAAYAEPNPVAEGITVQLYLDTDDKTICKFSDNSDETGSKDFSIMAGKFPGVDEKELHTEHTTEYSISFLGEKKDYSLNVQCQNGAGALSEIKELTFTVDYTIAGNIVSLSPSGSIPSRNVTLAVGTNKNALCSYFDNSSYVAMGGAGGIDHSTVLSSLIEQEYIFPIKCQISDHIVEAQIQFAVDLTPPRVTSVDDGTRTCGLNEIPSILIYTDENVTHFSYELFKEVSNFNRSSNSTDELVSSGTIPVEQPLTISGLNLEEGETYYLKALAQDAAGFWSSTQVVSDGVLATGSNDTICERDASSPRVTFSTNESCTSVGVQMHCNDDVGCGAIEYGISTSSSSCEVTRGYSGGPLTVDESSWICYSAADRSGNNNSQLKLITFPDTDGDGIANSCDSCAATGNGKIVDSNGCADGQLSNGQELEDADGDGLPDSWEKRYDAIDCSLNFESEDSDANGVRDSDEDYDDDGLNNYEEYTGLRNPCLSDAPISREDDERSFDLPTPTSDGPDVVAIVLFVIGLLMVAGGVGYLVWYYKKTPGQPQRKVAEIQRAVIGKPQIKKTPEWKKNLLFRRKEREERARLRQTKSVFGSFDQSSSEIPHVGAALSRKAPHLTKLHDLAHEYADHKAEIKPGLQSHEKGIFAQLSQIANKTKKKPIAEVVSKKEAHDIFSQLRKIAKKRKKK